MWKHTLTHRHTHTHTHTHRSKSFPPWRSRVPTSMSEWLTSEKQMLWCQVMTQKLHSGIWRALPQHSTASKIKTDWASTAPIYNCNVGYKWKWNKIKMNKKAIWLIFWASSPICCVQNISTMKGRWYGISIESKMMNKVITRSVECACSWNTLSPRSIAVNKSTHFSEAKFYHWISHCIFSFHVTLSYFLLTIIMFF